VRLLPSQLEVTVLVGHVAADRRQQGAVVALGRFALREQSFADSRPKRRVRGRDAASGARELIERPATHGRDEFLEFLVRPRGMGRDGVFEDRYIGRTRLELFGQRREDFLRGLLGEFGIVALERASDVGVDLDLGCLFWTPGCRGDEGQRSHHSSRGLHCAPPRVAAHISGGRGPVA
jgi:hypothetical protein